MAVDLKNVMLDFERIMKEIAKSELTLKAVKKLREEQADFKSSRQWGYEESYQYDSAVIVATKRVASLNNSLAELEAFHKVNRQQLDKVCHYYDDDDNEIRKAHEKRMSFLVEVLGNDDADQQLKDILEEKEIVPTVTYGAVSNRLEESLSDEERINQSCVLATQDLTTEIRLVYEDNPDEPVACSSLLYWLYDNDPANSDAIEPDVKAISDDLKVMLPIGVGVTDSSGNLMQSVAVPDGLGVYQINEETNQLMVKSKLSTWKAYKIATNARLQASSFRDHVTDANGSIENSNSSYEVVNNYKGDLGGEFDWHFLNYMKKNKPLKKSVDITIPQQIMANIVAKGFDEEDHENLEKEMSLAGWRGSDKRDLAAKISIHSFNVNRKYGFLLYPADRGNFASVDVTTLTQPLDFPSVEGVDAPVITKGAAWAESALPKPELNGNELRSTIALYCTLPEWDKRLCRVLYRLERAHINFNQSVHNHTENMFRIKRMQQLAELHRQYHYDSFNEKEKATNDGLIDDLEAMYSGISGWIESPDDSDAIGLKKLKDEVEAAAKELWDLIGRPAFSQELARYMSTVAGKVDGGDGPESERGMPSGPYMTVEPFWTHIFETLGKCYAAFKNTEIEEKAWTEHVEGLVLWVANNEDRELSVDETEAEGLRNAGVDEEDLPTVISPLSKRLLDRGRDSEGINNVFFGDGNQDTARNPLYIMMDGYTEIASIFHRVPGPPSVVQVALDVYSDHVSKLIGRSVVGKKSLHIKLFFGISKLYGLTKADIDFNDSKSDVYQLLRRHGRQYRPGGKKPNGKRNKISLSAQDVSDRHILRGFPEFDENGRAGIKGKDSQSFSEMAYTGRRHLAYKSVMQVFHWLLYFETWGHQEVKNAADEKISLKYIRDVLEGVEVAGGNYVKVISAKLLINQMLAGGGLAERGLAKGFMQAGSGLAVHADKIALRLGVLGVTTAALDTVRYLDKGFYGQSFMEMNRSVGLAMVSYGYAARQFPEGVVVKVGQSVAKAAVKRFAWLGAVIWIPVAGQMALVVGSVLSTAVFAYDIAGIVVEMNRTNMHDYFHNYWDAFKNSTFGKEEDKNECIEYYESEIPNSGEFAASFKSADGRRYTILGEDSGVDWQQLSWRAIIPLHLMGYDNEFIGNLVEIEGMTIDDALDELDDELDFINEKPTGKDARTETFDVRHSRVKGKPKNFGVGSLVRFYAAVSSKENSELTFENGNTYRQVADSLEEGTFIPDREQPEMLPKFDELLDSDGSDYNNKRIQALANEVGWYSDDFYKIVDVE